MKEAAPLVFDIKRHALDDGPGIRTTVFFKGCPLRCLWCHNPESKDTGVEIGFYPADCIRCGDCAQACPAGAAQPDRPQLIDRARCTRCGKCAAACPGRGLRQIGHRYEVDKLVDIVLRDRVYYQTSGGGVTLSGGEPTLHTEYVSRLLRALKSKGISTAIETCGFFDWPRFRAEMLDWLDLILFDVKLADPDVHVKYTGKRNESILENLAALARYRPECLVARVPLVPGVTTSHSNLQQISGILQELAVKRCWLLPYNPHGLAKLGTIGKAMVNMPDRLLSSSEMDRFKAYFSWAELVDN